MFLKRISAHQIKDSRNKATIEVSINGCKASAPSGKSTSKSASPLYHKSLKWNIDFLNNATFGLEINSLNDLKKVELFLKKKLGMRDAKKFGANALVALEIAILKALAKSRKIPLWQIINPQAKRFPLFVGNAIGGGLHSYNKDKPEFQEFLIISDSPSPKKNLEKMQQIHLSLKKQARGVRKNDEGAWQTSLRNEEIFKILSKYKGIRFGADCAASSFYKKDYKYKEKILKRDQQIKYTNYLIKKFNLIYIEDPLQEKDFSGFARVTRSKNHLVVGDDLTATQIPLLKKAIKNKSINAMIVKPNQNGSLLEVAQIMKICKQNKIKTVLSHRSGETMDNALADLAFGFQSDFMKAGIATKWREAKLNRLVEIEKSLE